MSKKSVRPEELEVEIMSELSKYSEEVTEQIKEDVKEVAAECLAEIKEGSPVNRGDYKKGWRKKVMFDGPTDIRVRIYNAKEPQLAHLLEFGHPIVRKGRVVGRAEGKKHIYPAEQRAVRALGGKAKVAVKG